MLAIECAIKIESRNKPYFISTFITRYLELGVELIQNSRVFTLEFEIWEW